MRAADASHWIAAGSLCDVARIARRSRAVGSMSPNCSGAARFNGPPNDRGWRPSFSTVVGCASHDVPWLASGAADAGDTDAVQSSATLPAVVSARTIDDKKRIETVTVEWGGFTIPQAADTAQPGKRYNAFNL